MKKLIVLLCLIFIPALTASDTSTYVLAVSGQDAGTDGDWYYSVGSDSYGSHDGYGANTRAGDKWTPGVSGDITKISYKSYTGGANPLNYTLALWTWSGSNWTRQRCVTGQQSGGTIDGWVDLNVTAYTITSSTQILVTWIGDGNINFWYTGSTGGYYADNQTYANECSTASISDANDWHTAVRVWVE